MPLTDDPLAEFQALLLEVLAENDQGADILGKLKAHPASEPFHDYLDRPPLFSLPPVLNLEPTDFLIELSDHYLFAALHEIFYASLMAENRRRVRHLEGAVKHLDEESDALRRQSNARRQEEIIEEIEVILLSAASLKKTLPKRP